MASEIRCRLTGHRYRFWAERETMHWRCQRDCGAEGSKRYRTAADAARYASAFDREDREALGRRPTLSALPLWLARRIRGL